MLAHGVVRQNWIAWNRVHGPENTRGMTFLLGKYVVALEEINGPAYGVIIIVDSSVLFVPHILTSKLFSAT